MNLKRNIAKACFCIPIGLQSNSKKGEPVFNKIVISPSILSADFLNLSREVSALEHAGADWVHYDVMDGHFVPNLTVGVPVLKQLRAVCSVPLDVHLMIANPLEQLPWFLECSPDYVTIHWEALGEDREEEEAQKAVELIQAAGAKAGIALKPDTPTGVLDTTLALWDMVLVMSVFPGFSGQSYIPESAQRVREVVAACTQQGLSPLIQVDGGIGAKTAPLVAAFGADVLVAGNAVFKTADYARSIQEIRSAATSAQTKES